jgi:hypothetical protein
MFRRLTTAELVRRLVIDVLLQVMEIFFFLEGISYRNWFWILIFGPLSVISTRHTIIDSDKWKEPR